MSERKRYNARLKLVLETDIDFKRCEQYQLVFFEAQKASPKLSSFEENPDERTLHYELAEKVIDIEKLQLHPQGKSKLKKLTSKKIKLVCEQDENDERTYVFVPGMDATSSKYQTFIIDTTVQQENAVGVIRNEQNDAKAGYTSLIKHFLMFIVPLLLALVSYHMVNYGGIQKGHSYADIESFQQSMQTMRKSFPSQYSLYFNMLTNSGKRHLERIFEGDQEDLRPLSYLMVTYEDSENVLDCFLEKLGNSFTIDTFSTIQSKEFKSDDASRLNLDLRIKAKLTGYQKLVVVKDIHELSFKAAQLFMTYADEYNDLATYPQSTIFLSVSLPFKSTGNRKEDEQRVSSFMQDDVWGDQSTVDNKAALWTRIGDGIVVLKAEGTIPC